MQTQFPHTLADRSHITEMICCEPVDPLGDRHPRNPILEPGAPMGEPVGLTDFEHRRLYPMEYKRSRSLDVRRGVTAMSNSERA